MMGILHLQPIGLGENLIVLSKYNQISNEV